MSLIRPRMNRYTVGTGFDYGLRRLYNARYSDIALVPQKGNLIQINTESDHRTVSLIPF